jgi:hypothetical protein
MTADRIATLAIGAVQDTSFAGSNPFYDPMAFQRSLRFVPRLQTHAAGRNGYRALWLAVARNFESATLSRAGRARTCVFGSKMGINHRIIGFKSSLSRAHLYLKIAI